MNEDVLTMNDGEVLVLDKETMDTMIKDAHKYIYNLMGYEGEFTEDKFQEATDKLDRDNLFTVYKPIDMQTDLVTLTQGYGFCGLDFLKRLIDEDKDSAYHVFESVVQDWMDLQEFLRDVTSRLESENAKLKEAKDSLENKDSQENKES